MWSDIQKKCENLWLCEATKKSENPKHAFLYIVRGLGTHHIFRNKTTLWNSKIASENRPFFKPKRKPNHGELLVLGRVNTCAFTNILDSSARHVWYQDLSFRVVCRECIWLQHSGRNGWKNECKRLVANKRAITHGRDSVTACNAVFVPLDDPKYCWGRRLIGLIVCPTGVPGR